MKQQGQILLILILVMTVGLTIGLSVIQRSITDVSTSSKLEQSSRALSAAEGGIERALNGSQTAVNFTENNSAANTIDSGWWPIAARALEYPCPPCQTKEDMAQIWLADPNPALSLPQYYNQDSLVAFWGDPTLAVSKPSERPALELSIIYQDASSNYNKKQYFFDPGDGGSRLTNNNFTNPSSLANSGCSSIPPSYSAVNEPTLFGSPTSYYCKVTVTGLSGLIGGSGKLIMVRARFLYNGVGQQLALAPTNGASLPPQAHIYTSTGTSGDTQRKVQLFKLDQVVPPYLDYAIFSAGAIVK